MPAPVTRATLPSSEAAAMPRGPGMRVKRPPTWPGSLNESIEVGAPFCSLLLVAVVAGAAVVVAAGRTDSTAEVRLSAMLGDMAGCVSWWYIGASLSRIGDYSGWYLMFVVMRMANDHFELQRHGLLYIEASRFRASHRIPGSSLSGRPGGTEAHEDPVDGPLHFRRCVGETRP